MSRRIRRTLASMDSARSRMPCWAAGLHGQGVIIPISYNIQNLAVQLAPRLTEELREEERTVVYRQLLNQLIKVGTENQQGKHVTAELIRSIFDVDRMLYYVF